MVALDGRLSLAQQGLQGGDTIVIGTRLRAAGVNLSLCAPSGGFNPGPDVLADPAGIAGSEGGGKQAGSKPLHFSMTSRVIFTLHV